MKKNVFSRAIAVLASTAVLGAASMMSANAAGESVSISSAEGKPGETVTLTVSVSTGNLFESMDGKVSFDSALTAGTAKGAGDCSVQSSASADFVTVVGFGSAPIADGAIATIDFTIPEDAEAGKTYDVAFESIKNFGVYEADGETAGPDIAESVAKSGGTITVVGEDTEPTTVEDTTAAETTAAETTKAAETTAAATTTKAAATTAKAASTGAPKTGTAGVAIAVAGLVTAGAAAVVLKKRH